jgi:hypothetical protein
MVRSNVWVAQALLPVWVLQSAHSQEWLCYSTLERHSELSEGFLFDVQSKKRDIVQGASS